MTMPTNTNTSTSNPGGHSHEVIVQTVADFIERFVFLRTRSLYQLLSLWTISTHMYSDFDYTGYIFACSPEPQSGKSRLLEVLDLLVANPSGILISPTQAILFRTAGGNTQLLDEVDGWTNREELRNVLNAGFQQGATVQRMGDHSGGGYEVQSFPVYAPRVLAGIGRRILNRTTLDRSFIFDMVRQTRDERRERFQRRAIQSEAEELKSAITSWVSRHKTEVLRCYGESPFSYLQDFRDRTIDVTQPLAAIVEVAYLGHPERGQAISALTEAVVITRREDESLTDGHKILSYLVQLARSENPLVGNATELTLRCRSLGDEAIEETSVSSTLRRYGFEPRSIRKSGTAKYRYSLPLAALTELVQRYVGDVTATEPGREAAVAVPFGVVDVVAVVVEELQATDVHSGRSVEEVTPLQTPTTLTTDCPEPAQPHQLPDGAEEAQTGLSGQ
jgi:hypothetical protein